MDSIQQKNPVKLTFLNKDFNLLDKNSNRYLLIIIVLTFSIFFLNVFEPFNIARWFSDSGIIRFLRLSSYGVVVAFVYLFTQFPLRKLFNQQKFKIKTYILWLILEIVLISLVYIFLYGNPLGNFVNDLLFSIKYTLLGIILPYTFAILIIYYKNQGAEIKQLQLKISQPAEERLTFFKDENGKIKFSVLAKDLLLLESTDNYVSVFYILNNKVQRKLLRNTLKNLEEMFKDSSTIRCHRSFVVNSQNIEFMQKEGKKLNLKVKLLDRTIPVSQKYSSLFIDFLS